MFLGNRIRFSDGPQARHRIGDLGVQAGKHGRNLVAAGAIRLAEHRIGCEAVSR
jgi:hypothetical protein